MTLYDWLNIWLEKYEKNSIKRTTYVSYDGYIKNHFIELKDVQISKITASLLQDFYNKKFDEGLSAKTIRNISAVLKKALKQAVIEKHIDQNYALYVNLPKVKKREIQVLTHDQQEKLLKASYLYRYGAFIRLTLCTGVRLGELLALKWEDIDFDKKELHIRRSLSRSNNYDRRINNATSIYFDEPKTEKSKRTIPLPQNALEDLLRWQIKQQNEVGKVEFIITDRNGKYLEHTTFKKYYNRMLDKCNIIGITFHALRHTFATSALEKGMDIKVLSEILGHYSVSFTLDTYAHVLNAFKRQNMELMNDIYENSNYIKNLVLCFKPFKNQYIVSIPSHSQYTFIAENVQDGVDYIREHQHDIILTKEINVQQILSNRQADEIIIFID